MNPEQCSQRPDGVWVCGECGFAYDLPPAVVSQRLVAAATCVRETLAAIEPGRLDMPARCGVWTPSEYLAHMTDWSEIIADRIDRVLYADRPTLRSLDQDLLAIEKDYASWDVAAALDRYDAAVNLARTLVDEAGLVNWERRGVRDDLGEVSLSLIANDLIHEIDHHLLDIQGISVSHTRDNLS